MANRLHWTPSTLTGAVTPDSDTWYRYRQFSLTPTQPKLHHYLRGGTRSVTGAPYCIPSSNLSSEKMQQWAYDREINFSLLTLFRSCWEERAVGWPLEDNWTKAKAGLEVIPCIAAPWDMVYTWSQWPLHDIVSCNKIKYGNIKYMGTKVWM